MGGDNGTSRGRTTRPCRRRVMTEWNISKDGKSNFPVRTEPQVLPQGTWYVENLRVGENWSVVAGKIQVAVCGRRDVAEAICDAMNARNLLMQEVEGPREDFSDRLGLFVEPSDGQKRVLNHMLHLLERRGVE